MLRVRVTGTLLLIVLTTVIATGAVRADEVVEREFPFESGARLVLDLDAGGSAIIVGWDRPTAVVVYEDDVAGLDHHEIEIRVKGGGLRISGEWTGRSNYSTSLGFEIRVPREIELEFRSNGGGLELENLSGVFEGRTAGGELRLRDVEGEVQLQTGGGSMEVIDCRLDGRLQTGGGEVLMENVVGDLEATSGGGNVQYRNVRGHDGELRSPGRRHRHGWDGSDEDITEETVLITTAGGGIDIAEAPAGAQLRTGGGGIVVEHAERSVIAETGGGDIEIQVGDGWVKASTGAGDIEVEVERGLGDGDEGIRLTTGTGDIVVELPPGLSIDVDVEIAYTRNSKREYRIKSDLELEVEHSDEWDYDRGTPRKYIRGTTVVGDGQHRIRIGTVNGNIHLRIRD